MKKKRTKLKDRTLPKYTKGEEIFNMTTHIVGGAFGVITLALGIIIAAIHKSTVGIIFFKFGTKIKYFHSIFHIFCILGSICFSLAILLFIL